MGIESTRDINRQTAIDRIKNIVELVEDKNYREIESITNEDSDYSIREFVDAGIDFDIEHIDRWTNGMIEEIIDQQYFRFSMRDNYNIIDEDEEY